MQTVFGFALGLVLSVIASTLAAAPTNQTQVTTPAPKSAPPAHTFVIIETTQGNMTVELFDDKAPLSVANFLSYVDKGYYDGVIFHRIIPNFMVQTGGFDSEYQRKATTSPITNESNNGLKNQRGTLSMARTNDPDSATAQFFINLNDNGNLDWRPGQPGYAVFGTVVQGIEAIDKMAALEQGQHRGVFINAPNQPVLIKKAYRTPKPSSAAKSLSPIPAENVTPPQAPKHSNTSQ